MEYSVDANDRVLTNWQYLRNELRYINILLLNQVRRRSLANSTNQFDNFQGVVITEQEVVSILLSSLDSQDSLSTNGTNYLNYTSISADAKNQIKDDTKTDLSYSLNRLVTLFKLSEIERTCILLCLASEIDSRYSKVYGFLNDDITKKHLTVELALAIIVEDAKERIIARSYFDANSNIIKNRLLHIGDSQDNQIPIMQRALWIDERITAFLLDSSSTDRSLYGWCEVYQPSATTKVYTCNDYYEEKIRGLIKRCCIDDNKTSYPILYFYGKNQCKQTVSINISQKLNVPLLLVNIRQMLLQSPQRLESLWRLGRESYLTGAMIHIDHISDLFDESRHSELNEWINVLNHYSSLTIMCGKESWKGKTPKQTFITIECENPDIAERVLYWQYSLQGTSHKLNNPDIEELASTYCINQTQIVNAIKRASDQVCWDRNSSSPITKIDLQNACRYLATLNLKGLGRKVDEHFKWKDIVLPAAQLDQLKELITHVKRSHSVYEQWGFRDKLPYGRGITALFNGSSGTGKTMAASIIAAELGLDLYKVDLSCVVSKYIGETEKNLTYIFDEAQNSSSVLFFDEADALFGKRSEVKDSRDRYANIETAFLLQKIEEYTGVVILASNMKQNMDEAFVRRIRFIIHFPLPGDAERVRMWEMSFPKSAPLSKDVDIQWLARKLKISGAHIKNISLRAAFLASERRSEINMNCLIEAAKRELGKTGKVITLVDSGIRDDNQIAYVSPEE